MHVQAGQHQTAGLDGGQRNFQLAVPDAVLAVLAAGVGLVAVAVAKAGVDAQPDMVALGDGSQLVQHVNRPCVHGHLVLHHGGESCFVHHVGGEDDVGRFAKTGGVARSQRTQNLTARDRIHLHALLAHQLEDVDVGAGLLCKAHGVESLELGNALADGGGVIDPQRRAVLVGQVPELGGSEGIGHLCTFIAVSAGQLCTSALFRSHWRVCCSSLCIQSNACFCEVIHCGLLCVMNELHQPHQPYASSLSRRDDGGSVTGTAALLILAPRSS